MADISKISELPVATTSAAADSIPIVQGGVTKRIHPGPAGGLDADTVSGYGIGAAKKLTSIDLDTVRQGGAYAPGLYGIDVSCTHTPIASYGTLVCVGLDEAGSSQLYLTVGQQRTFFRYYSSVAWSAWFELWGSGSDGNGGVAPAPKPSGSYPIAKNSLLPGQSFVEDVTVGANLVAPNISGGTCTLEIQTYEANMGSGATYKYYITACHGGTVDTLAGANSRIKWTRIS
jgi:hypothetical protein